MRKDTNNEYRSPYDITAAKKTKAGTVYTVRDNATGDEVDLTLKPGKNLTLALADQYFQYHQVGRYRGTDPRDPTVYGTEAQQTAPGTGTGIVPSESPNRGYLLGLRDQARKRDALSEQRFLAGLEGENEGAAQQQSRAAQAIRKATAERTLPKAAMRKPLSQAEKIAMGAITLPAGVGTALLQAPAQLARAGYNTATGRHDLAGDAVSELAYGAIPFGQEARGVVEGYAKMRAGDNTRLTEGYRNSEEGKADLAALALEGLNQSSATELGKSIRRRYEEDPVGSAFADFGWAAGLPFARFGNKARYAGRSVGPALTRTGRLYVPPVAEGASRLQRLGAALGAQEGIGTSLAQKAQAEAYKRSGGNLFREAMEGGAGFAEDITGQGFTRYAPTKQGVAGLSAFADPSTDPSLRQYTETPPQNLPSPTYMDSALEQAARDRAAAAELAVRGRGQDPAFWRRDDPRFSVPEGVSGEGVPSAFNPGALPDAAGREAWARRTYPSQPLPHSPGTPEMGIVPGVPIPSGVGAGGGNVGAVRPPAPTFAATGGRGRVRPLPSAVPEAIEATQNIEGVPTNAIQEQGTNEGVLRQERPAMGLQGVAGENAVPEGTPRQGQQAQSQTGGQAQGVMFTARNEAIPYRWRAGNIGSVRASHDLDLKPTPGYPTEMQPREREGSVTSEGWLEAKSLEANPYRLIDSPEPGSGASVTTPEGDVIAGNGRKLLVEKVYANENKSPRHKAIAENMRQVMRQRAADMGIDLSNEPYPFVWREMTDARTPEEYKRLAQEMNRDTQISQDAGETARRDTRMLTATGALGRLTPEAGGGFGGQANRPFRESFFMGVDPETGRPAFDISETSDFFNQKTGRLTLAGKARMQNAMLSYVFGDADFVSDMATGADYAGAKNAANAVIDNVALLAKLKHEIESGNVPKGLDISDALTDAIRTLNRVKGETKGASARQAARALVEQPDMFGGTISAETKALVNLFSDAFLPEKPKKVDFYTKGSRNAADFIENYANAALARSTGELGSQAPAKALTLIDDANRVTMEGASATPQSVLDFDTTPTPAPPPFAPGERVTHGGAESQVVSINGNKATIRKLRSGGRNPLYDQPVEVPVSEIKKWGEAPVSTPSKAPTSPGEAAEGAGGTPTPPAPERPVSGQRTPEKGTEKVDHGKPGYRHIGSAEDAAYKKTGGWKLHLTVDPKNYAAVDRWLDENHPGQYKLLTGGEPGEKDFTVYIGHRDDAQGMADRINAEIGSLLEENKAIAEGDRSFGGKVAGRFDIKTQSKGRFNRYGREGVPYTSDADEARQQVRAFADSPEDAAKWRRIEDNHFKAIDKELTDQYGDFYTGKQAETPSQAPAKAGDTVTLNVSGMQLHSGGLQADTKITKTQEAKVISRGTDPDGTPTMTVEYQQVRAGRGPRRTVTETIRADDSRLVKPAEESVPERASASVQAPAKPAVKQIQPENDAARIQEGLRTLYEEVYYSSPDANPNSPGFQVSGLTERKFVARAKQLGMTSEDAGIAYWEAVGNANSAKADNLSTPEFLRDNSRTFNNRIALANESSQAPAKGKIQANIEAAEARIKERKSKPKSLGAGAFGGEAASDVIANILDYAIIGTNKIAQGATNFTKFVDAMRKEYGTAYDSDVKPYINHVWKEAVKDYEARVKPTVAGAPDVEKTLPDYLPDYQSEKYRPDAALVDDLYDGLIRMAADNRILAARGGVEHVPLSVTREDAKLLVDTLGPVRLAKLQEMGIDLPVLTQAIEQQRDAALLRANDAAKEYQASPTPENHVEFIRWNEMANLMTLDSITNRTALGRAMRNLQKFDKALSADTDTAIAFQQMFEGTAGPAPVPSNFAHVAQNAPAPTGGPQSLANLLNRAKTPEENIAGVAAGMSEGVSGVPTTASERIKARAKRAKSSAVGEAYDFSTGQVQAKAPPPPKARAKKFDNLNDLIASDEKLSRAKTSALSKIRAGWKRQKGGGFGSLQSGLLDQELVEGIAELAGVYVKAGARSFAEFVFQAKPLLKQEFPDEPESNIQQALEEGWKASGRTVERQGTVDLGEPKNTPATTGKFITRPEVPEARFGTTAEEFRPMQGRASQAPAKTKAVQQNLPLPEDVKPIGTTRELPPPSNRRSRQQDLLGPEDLLSEPKPGMTNALPEPTGAKAEQLNTGEDIGHNTTKLFLPDRTEAVRKKLAKEYRPPTDVKRDPKTVPALTEIGGYIYEQGNKKFPEWVIEMNAALGKKIDANDLKAAWEGMAEAAGRRLRFERDYRQMALKRASEILSPEDAQKAAQEMRDISPTDPKRAEKYAAIVAKYHKPTKMQTLAEALGLLRSMKTSFDLSAPGRQGFFLLSRPKESAKAAGAMFKVLWNDVMNKHGASDEIMNKIHTDPYYDLAEKSGLSMTEVGGASVDLSKREENFMTSIVHEMANRPLTSGYHAKSILWDNPATRLYMRGLNTSERTFATFMNYQRMEVFKSISENYIKNGYTPEVHPELFKATADWINDLSGRGKLPEKWEKGNTPAIMASALFSPRYQASRIRLLATPARLITAPAPLRKQMLRDIVGTAAMTLPIYAFAKFMGADVETDWRSSNFLKIRVGKDKITRLEIIPGLGGYLRAIGQIVTRTRLDDEGNEVELEGDSPLSKTGLDVAAQLARSKAAPIPGEFMNFLAGKDLVGKPTYRGTPGQIAGDIGWAFGPAPIQVRDVYDAATSYGGKEAGWHILATFGIGVQTYDPSQDRETRN